MPYEYFRGAISDDACCITIVAGILVNIRRILSIDGLSINA